MAIVCVWSAWESWFIGGDVVEEVGRTLFWIIEGQKCPFLASGNVGMKKKIVTYLRNIYV